MFIRNFAFEKEHLDYLRTHFDEAPEEFFTYLKGFNMNDIEIVGMDNLQIVQPHIPLMTIKGPLAKVQLIETALINFFNYPSLLASLANL